MRSPTLSKAEEQELAALRSQVGRWDVSAEECRRLAPARLARERDWQDKMDIWRARDVHRAQTFYLGCLVLLGVPLVIVLAVGLARLMQRLLGF